MGRSRSLNRARPYVRDVDLGNGKHQALVSPLPINYQDSHGTWQPIDPRFEAAPGGFISRRNSLVIGAAQQQAFPRLEALFAFLTSTTRDPPGPATQAADEPPATDFSV